MTKQQLKKIQSSIKFINDDIDKGVPRRCALVIVGDDDGIETNVMASSKEDMVLMLVSLCEQDTEIRGMLHQTMVSLMLIEQETEDQNIN